MRLRMGHLRGWLGRAERRKVDYDDSGYRVENAERQRVIESWMRLWNRS